MSQLKNLQENLKKLIEDGYSEANEPKLRMIHNEFKLFVRNANLRIDTVDSLFDLLASVKSYTKKYNAFDDAALNLDVSISNAIRLTSGH